MAIKDKKRVDDHFSQKARKDGYPARSVYKLEEIDQKYKILKTGQKVLDLGCAPGSWTLYAAEKVGFKGRVLGIDIVEVSGAFPSQVKIIQANLLDNPIELVKDEAPFHLIISDMAPKTMGRKEVDQARSLELCEMAWSWAEKLLLPGGNFLFKIFQSQDAECFIKNMKVNFSKFYRVKPKASRTQSYEIFVLACDFKA